MVIDTDDSVESAGDKQRVIAGLNYRPAEAFVIKNELLYTMSQGSASTEYVGSFAVLF